MMKDNNVMRHVILYRLIFVILTYGIIPQLCGCTDACISRIIQSENGKVVVFSTHRWGTTYLVDDMRLVRCGVSPFSVSPSGELAISLTENNVSKLFIMKRGKDASWESSTIELDTCLPDKSFIVAIRCSNQQAILRMASVSHEPVNKKPRCVLVDIESGHCENTDFATWDNFESPISVDQVSNQDKDENVRVFRSRNGIIIREETSKYGSDRLAVFKKDDENIGILRSDLFTTLGKPLSMWYQPP